MKLYLDDARPAPIGWTLVQTAQEAIKALSSKTVVELSLDHDLGLEGEAGTGYDVLKWIEEQVVTNSFSPPPVMKVHSANPPARKRMELAIQAIRRLTAG